MCKVNNKHNCLPKVNKQNEKSQEMIAKLEIAFFEAKVKLEKEHDYQFRPYELDLMHLKKITRNHEFYLKSAFSEKDNK